jgi:hypothetical protein
MSQSFDTTKVAINNPLGTEDYFKKLMQEAVGADSLYIRTKETLDSFLGSEVESGTMTAVDRANILSKALVDLSTSITNKAMDTALEIAKEERDAVYRLTKAKEEALMLVAQREKLNQDKTNDQTMFEAQADKLQNESWEIQARLYRDYGVSFANISDDTSILSNTDFTNGGVKYQQEAQTRASAYATYAKSYRESGTVTWSPTSDLNAMSFTGSDSVGLTVAQEEVAKRQKTAFDDNMVQHAANSSANMIGLLLSSQQAGEITTADATTWRSAVGYLANPVAE